MGKFSIKRPQVQPHLEDYTEDCDILKDVDYSNLKAIPRVIEQPVSTGGSGGKGEKGDTGAPGKDGRDGKSAYQIWLDQGNLGTETDFINSLKGEKGESGSPGKDGANGLNGRDGNDGINGENGRDGETPEIRIGTVETVGSFEQAEVTVSQVGKDAMLHFKIPRGEGGASGVVPQFEIGNVSVDADGIGANVTLSQEDGVYKLNFILPKEPQNGKSAYELWLEGGNEGALHDFLASLKGKDGTSPNVEVGTVTQGSSASVVSRKEENTTYLDFVLPQTTSGGTSPTTTTKSIPVFNASTTFGDDRVDAFCRSGYVNTWGVVEDASSVNVGDTIMLRFVATPSNQVHIVLAQVNKKNSDTNLELTVINCITSMSQPSKAVYVSLGDIIKQQNITAPLSNGQALRYNFPVPFTKRPMLVLTGDMSGNYIFYYHSITQYGVTVSSNYIAGFKGFWYYSVEA